jgi:hypothetical protein
MARPKKLNTIELFKDLMRDPERKSVFKMTSEILSLLFVFKSFPRHYFSRYLFKKWRTNVKDFLPSKFLYNLKPFFNEKEVREVLENKLYFDLYYSQFGISLPKILMYNYKKMFVVGEKRVEVNNSNDFRILIGDLIRQNSLDSVFIKRTYWSFGGDKIFKIYPNQVNNEPETMENLYSEVIKAGFLFQETIKQHPDMNKLNPSCINTIRFDTFINPDGKIEIISGHIRMSIVNHYVDNVSSGGCWVGIDLKTGRLKKFAYRNFLSSGVELFTAHPVTKVTFENFEVPLLEEAKELVIKAAGCMPGLRLVGWDVALGETGAVLIEGNSDYDIAGNDNSDDGYNANQVFRKVLKELNYIK